MSETKLLAGKTAIISGGGSGLGFGIAQSLAAAGATVVLSVRRREAGEQALAQIKNAGGRGKVVVADAANPEQVDAAVAEVVTEFGGLDIVIHNANSPASSAPIKLEDVNDADWLDQARVAHAGAFNLAKSSFQFLRASSSARFILLASAFGLHGAGFNPVYSCLKGADRGFVKSLAREWGEFGITVLGVAPSALTPPTEDFFNTNPAIRDQYIKNFPLGRLGDPQNDVGTAFVALCSDHFRYITGQTIRVDGGLYTA